jgi:hypothetical protein
MKLFLILALSLFVFSCAKPKNKSLEIAEIKPPVYLTQLVLNADRKITSKCEAYYLEILNSEFDKFDWAKSNMNNSSYEWMILYHDIAVAYMPHDCYPEINHSLQIAKSLSNKTSKKYLYKDNLDFLYNNYKERN